MSRVERNRHYFARLTLVTLILVLVQTTAQLCLDHLPFLAALKPWVAGVAAAFFFAIAAAVFIAVQRLDAGGEAERFRLREGTPPSNVQDHGEPLVASFATAATATACLADAVGPEI